MTIKIKTINNQQVTELVMRMFWVPWICGTQVPWMWQQADKKIILLLKFASNTDFRQKMVAW